MFLVLVIRRCGVAALRRCGVAALRRCGVAALRRCGVAALRRCGVAALRRSIVYCKLAPETLKSTGGHKKLIRGTVPLVLHDENYSSSLSPFTRPQNYIGEGALILNFCRSRAAYSRICGIHES